MRLRSRAVAVATAAVVSGCVYPAPAVRGVGSAVTAGRPWVPPPQLRPERLTIDTAPRGVIPPDLLVRAAHLTLADVVDLALRNNPVTRLAWAQARAASATLGSAEGRYFPTVDASASLSRSRTVSTVGRVGGAERTQYGPALSLSYLLFDFGGRSGAVNVARENAFAAGFAYNTALQNTVLQVEGAFFTYAANRSLLNAEQGVVTEARANLAAAEQRRAVGLSTIADVLQARTALAQALLALETTQGDLQAARAGLALGMGLPPGASYDVSIPSALVPVRPVADSVDALIAEAVRDRPDLQAALANARAARAGVRVSRAAALPSLILNGSGGRTYSPAATQFAGTSYGLTLGLSIPLFNGFSRQYDIRAAQARADAATAQADLTRNQVIAQVFTSYYTLQTGTRRVATADALLASALQSEQVAAGRYRAGVGSIIDLLTAQSALANARAQQVGARWQWATALAQLAHDAGVLGARGETPVRLAPDTVRAGVLP